MKPNQTDEDDSNLRRLLSQWRVETTEELWQAHATAKAWLIDEVNRRTQTGFDTEPAGCERLRPHEPPNASKPQTTVNPPVQRGADSK